MKATFDGLQAAEKPECKNLDDGAALQRVIVPRALGGFAVRRVLPALEQRSQNATFNHGSPFRGAGLDAIELIPGLANGRDLAVKKANVVDEALETLRKAAA